MEKPTRQMGQGTVEYAIILALVAIAIVLALGLLGGVLRDAFDRVIMAFGGQVNYFVDEFDGDMSAWTVGRWGFFQGDWDVQGDKLRSDLLSAIFVKDFARADYQITVAGPSLVHEEKNWNGFGVFFRTSGDTRVDGYMFEIERVRPRDTGVMYFSKWIHGNQIRKPLASADVPAGFDWNNPGDFRIVVQGDTFTAHIGDRQVLSTTDDTFSEGGVGLASNGGSRLSVERVSIDPVR